MRKLSYWLSAAFLLASLNFTMVSCGDDDDDAITNEQTSGSAPVINKDFTVTVSGNTVVIDGSAISASTKYVTLSDGTQKNFDTEGKVTLTVNLKGSYTATVSVFVNGQVYTSESFTYVIEASDFSYLTSNIWKQLCNSTEAGGYTKKWYLDVHSVTYNLSKGNDGKPTSIVNAGSDFAHNPIDFWNPESTKDAWGPWGGTNISDWGGVKEVGYIEFDGANKKAHLVLSSGITKQATGATEKDGAWEPSGAEWGAVDVEGSFDLEISDRDNTETIQSGSSTVDKWTTIFNNQYTSYFESHTKNEQIAVLSFTDQKVRMPMDKRVADNNFKDEDLYNVAIYQIDDNSMIVDVYRSYEGYSSASALKESTCHLLYHFTTNTPEDGTNDVNTDNVFTSDNNAITSLCDGNEHKFLAPSWLSFETSNNWGYWASYEDAVSATNWSGNSTAVLQAAQGSITLTPTDNTTGTYKIVDAQNSVVAGAAVSAEFNGTYTINEGNLITFSSEVTMTVCGVVLKGTQMFFSSYGNTFYAGAVLISMINNKSETKSILVKGWDTYPAIEPTTTK